MSIWSSATVVGTDFDAPATDPRGGAVLSYAEGFSNHYPDLTSTHETPAAVHLAEIAPWCVPGHNQDAGFRCTGCGADHDFPESGPFVRLTVVAPDAVEFWTTPGQPSTEPVCSSVVLTVESARQLAADLAEWADRPKVTEVAT